MAKKKCYKCKESYDEKDMAHILRHWICPNCYPSYITSEGYYKEKFLADACALYGKKAPYQTLKSQAENLHDNYKFRYAGLVNALDYYLKRNEWNPRYFLYQAFPKAYYDARDYSLQVEKMVANPITPISDETTTVIATGSGQSFKPPLPL